MTIDKVRTAMYLVAPSLLHRDLSVSQIQKTLGRAADTFSAKDRHERSVAEAAAVGALRGAAYSRCNLSFLTRPTDAFFGAGITVSSSYSDGLVSNICEIPSAIFDLTAAPRLARLGASGGAQLGKLVNRFASSWSSLDESSGRDAGYVLANTLLCAPVSAGLAISMNICKAAAIWCSAAVKLMTIAPFALVGALVGTFNHLAHRNPGNTQDNFGIRGARNDETFGSMEPISSVPDQYFFLTEDSFGLDLRELQHFSQARGSLINPYTNTAFSERDMTRLKNHATGWFSNAEYNRLDGATLLSGPLFARHFNFFVNVAYALSEAGPDASSAHRRAGELLTEKIRDLYTDEAFILKLYFQTVTDRTWSEVLEDINEKPNEAREIAAMLLNASVNLSAVYALPQVTALQRSNPAYANTPDYKNILRSIAQAGQSIEPYSVAYVALRHPWIAKASFHGKPASNI